VRIEDIPGQSEEVCILTSAIAMQSALFRDARLRALDTVPGLRVVASGPAEDQIDCIPELMKIR
jgi:hypothetical protein